MFKKDIELHWRILLEHKNPRIKTMEDYVQELRKYYSYLSESSGTDDQELFEEITG